MFMSWQTFEGLQIKSFSLIECVKCLLNEGMEHVLMERFCQDPLEQYFDNKRKIGRRSDNPDIQQFGYSDNMIRIQRNVSHTSANTRGCYDKNRASIEKMCQMIQFKKKSNKKVLNIKTN